MSLLSEILNHNEQFVSHKEYERFETTRIPDKKLVILSCMDTRLTELLPRAMNLRNGDAKIIKCAGAVVAHPFGSIMRSILVAVYELGATEVAVIGHHDCGMMGLNCSSVLAKVEQRGIDRTTLDTLQNAGIDLQEWLSGFDTVEESVRSSVSMVRNHPLLPKDIKVHGLIIHPHTGKLEVVIDGYTPTRR
jgi:carbonic anhydrase